MKQVVYLDVLVLLNFVVDYFILRGVDRLNRTGARLRRLLGGGLTAGMCSASIFLPGENPFLSTLYQLLIAVLVVWVTFGFGSPGRFLRLCGSFFGITLAYAGIMFALWLIWKPKGMVIQNGVVYFDISPMILIVSSLIAYLLLLLLRRITSRTELRQKKVRLNIRLGEEQTSFDALVDTGHSLSDGLSNAPVVVAEYNSIYPIIPPECRRMYQDGNISDIPDDFVSRFRMIPFTSIGGEGMLPAFRPDEVTVLEESASRRVPSCVVAVLDRPLGEEYHALVGPELFNHDGR